jgi:hypothetical protein
MGVAHPSTTARARGFPRARRWRPFSREQRSDSIAEFAERFARLAHRPPAARQPAPGSWSVRSSPVRPGRAVFSNIQLREIGFRFLYPTLEQGLQQVLGASMSNVFVGGRRHCDW